jgi:hypothetical protein
MSDESGDGNRLSPNERLIGGGLRRRELLMAMPDNNGNDTQRTEAKGIDNSIILAWAVLYALLGVVSTISGILKFPNELKLVILFFVALFWGFFEFNKRVHITTLNLIWKRIQQRQGVPSDTEREAQTPGVRVGVGGLLLLFLLGWGYEKLNEPPNLAETTYYMVVLDASDAMKEPFDTYPSKWVAVQEAFQQFYARSHPDSNYGLVLIGGQNPQERSREHCFLPTVPMIPVVSESGKVLPHRKLTLPNLQDQIEGQQPQGGASLIRAFFLAKNHLESHKLGEPISSMVIVLIANASDSCAGKIDWDTLADTIELANEKIAVRKELILLDMDATQEVTAFADETNAKNDPNMIVQVVSNYYELKLSISYVMERNEATVEALQTAATATAQSEKNPIPNTGGQGPATGMTITPMPRRVVVAASATSTHTLTPIATSTFTPTLTFTPTVTSTLTRTKTPTLPPINKPLPTRTASKPGGGGGSGSGGGGGSGFDRNGDGKVKCNDFSTQSEALVALNAGYSGLDGDRDGIPCESLPP